MVEPDSYEMMSNDMMLKLTYHERVFADLRQRLSIIQEGSFEILDMADEHLHHDINIKSPEHIRQHIKNEWSKCLETGRLNTINFTLETIIPKIETALPDLIDQYLKKHDQAIKNPHPLDLVFGTNEKPKEEDPDRRRKLSEKITAELLSYKILLEFIREQSPSDLTTKKSSSGKHLNFLWFKVGLLFANGKMQKLLSEHNNNCTQVANELGDADFRPYISETVSKATVSDKNIYSSKKKMIAIRDYCIEHKIQIDKDFLEQLNSLQSKS